MDTLRNRTQEELDEAYLLEEIPAALDQSLEGLERISKIVRAMKEFSHPGEKDKKAADLNSIIKSTVIVATNEWKYIAELDTDLDPDLPPVLCFASEIGQVILNLIVNAAQSIEERVKDEGMSKGRITVTSAKKGNEAIICVSDTGSGIAEDIQSKIFDPFFTTKDVGVGSGQGLSMAYSIVVKKHAGQIDVQSDEGQGATFTVKIPINDSESKKPQPGMEA